MGINAPVVKVFRLRIRANKLIGMSVFILLLAIYGKKNVRDDRNHAESLLKTEHRIAFLLSGVALTRDELEYFFPGHEADNFEEALHDMIKANEIAMYIMDAQLPGKLAGPRLPQKDQSTVRVRLFSLRAV